MKQISKIRVLSFDGDMTLWDFQKVMRHSLAVVLDELHKALGESVRHLTIDKMIEIRNRVAAELKGRVVNLESIRLQAFKRTLASVDCADDALANKLNVLYLKHRFEDIELYPEVLLTLDTLRQNFCIGLLSNGNGYPERCGLPDRFSFVVFSQDVGIEKPAAEIFLTVCKKADCKPRELAHIGDSLASDVAGANNVGAISVWLNRESKPNNSMIIPDYEIKSLDELTEILK